MFIAGAGKEMGGSGSHTPSSPKGFGKAILKARWKAGGLQDMG